MNVCENGSKKQLIKVPAQEDEDLQEFINLYRQVFGVNYHQALFIGLAWIKLIEEFFLNISQKLYVWTFVLC